MRDWKVALREYLNNYYNDLLKGDDGNEYHLFDVTGMDRGIYSGNIYKKESPISGEDLKTTIDINLQNFVYESLKDFCSSTERYNELQQKKKKEVEIIVPLQLNYKR